MKKILVVFLCIMMVLQLCSCGSEKDNSSTSEYESSPEITITATPEGEFKDSDESDSEEEETPVIPISDGDDIESLVYGAVSYSLESAGFTCNSGVASSLNNSGFTAAGLYYYSDDLMLFNSEDIKAVGFVEVVSEDAEFVDLVSEGDIIGIESVDSDSEMDLICTYNYENIGSSHFVYNNKYVKYYQQTPMRVVYTVEDNLTVNYDLSLGSLYDYDNQEFIFDEAIWESYTTHSAVELFNETDYAKLEANLKELSDQQLEAGYVVNEYKIVYISPESIQAYLDSEEEDTFFGFSVASLTETFGLGKALEYTADGFQPSDYLQKERDNDIENYNWKTFLSKVAIGSGIILVGAVLTPATGGASFGCALLTITGSTLGISLSGALGSLAIETVKGMISGKSLKDAILDARVAGLNAFANGFMIGAAVSSVGVVSGLIKPVACFTAGTPVAIPGPDGSTQYKAIEDIKPGDYVYSYDERQGHITIRTVEQAIQNKTFEQVIITVKGETITTTPSHPFYLAEYGTWIPASDLYEGAQLLSSDGTFTVVESIEKCHLDADIEVYNLTVDTDHSYFVGGCHVLVHNTCDTISSLRSKAVKDAWKKEVEAVKSGTSKYDWSPGEIEQLLKVGKARGYEGHHIRTVKELIGTADEALIGSADDIVFLSKDAHYYVHAAGDVFDLTKDHLVELVPWIVERYGVLGLIA